MKHRSIADKCLAVTTGLGLVYSPVLLGLFIAPFIRGRLGKFRFSFGDYLLLAAAIWALIVMASRGTADMESKLLLQYLFIWSIPLLIKLYRPDEFTLFDLQLLIFFLFGLDFAFNLYSVVTHQDLLGRELDVREGVIALRNGGVFAHSFYSGTISLIAYVFLLSSRRFRLLALFAVLNLLLAGSFRLVIPILLVPVLLWRWQKRTRFVELILVFVFSVAAVLSVLATSSFWDFGFNINPSNDLRIFAWINAIEKISNSLLLGVGYPKSDFVGIDVFRVDDALIGESWYLTAALTFGLPYLMLRFLGLLYIFYGPRFTRRTVHEAVLTPVLLIDLAYGGAFESILFYILLWIILEKRSKNNPYNPVAI